MPDKAQVHSWASGPPKSETENWNLGRRNELLSLATSIFVKAVEHESFGEAMTPKKAVDFAADLIQEAESRVPRF